MAGFWDFFGGMAKEGARDLRETHEANEKLKRELSFQERLLQLQDELEQRREKRKPTRTVHSKNAEGKWEVISLNAFNEPVSDPQLVSTEEARKLEQDELLGNAEVDKAKYETGKGRELSEQVITNQIAASKASQAASYQSITADRERIEDANTAEEVSVLEKIGQAREDAQALISGDLGNDPIPAILKGKDGKPVVSEMHKALKDLTDAQKAYQSAGTPAEKKEALLEIARLTSYIGAARANKGITARDRASFSNRGVYGGMPGAFEQAISEDGYDPRKPN